MRALLMLVLACGFIAGCSEERPHMAPISKDAIPDRIGCAEGCEKSNQFDRWQSYLPRVVEMQRKLKNCASVEWASASIDSDPSNPSFFVTCNDKAGRAYNTFYTKAQIDAGVPKTDTPLTRTQAMVACDSELPGAFPGFKEGDRASVDRNYTAMPNGLVRLTYELKVSGVNRRATCLVGQDSFEFFVVK